jgi:TetR/AcrR family transcriptional regulator, transcriptional repressor for nem operon
MSKGEQTREMILHQAARLFNRRGFFGSALSDVMDATGLEKGGIYNHFKSKEDLAFQAFDYAVDLLRKEIAAAIKSNKNTVDRLRAMIAVYQREAEGYPLPGGCPIMNTAIEADDAHPALRARAQQAMDDMRDAISRTVRLGKERGEIKPEVDAETFSILMLCAMEGAIMLSKLYGNLKPVNRAAAYLTEILEREVRAT